jgi:hypothetical protein
MELRLLLLLGDLLRCLRRWPGAPYPRLEQEIQKQAFQALWWPQIQFCGPEAPAQIIGLPFSQVIGVRHAAPSTLRCQYPIIRNSCVRYRTLLTPTRNGIGPKGNSGLRYRAASVHRCSGVPPSPDTPIRPSCLSSRQKPPSVPHAWGFCLGSCGARRMTLDNLHDFVLIGAAPVVVCIVTSSDPRGDELGLIKRVLLCTSFAPLFMAVYLIAVLM